jgi:hypothetical protein
VFAIVSSQATVHTGNDRSGAKNAVFRVCCVLPRWHSACRYTLSKTRSSNPLKLLEVGASVRLQTADLAIEHSGVRADRLGDFLGELWPLHECVAVTGDKLAAMAADMRQCPEAVKLRLEDEVGTRSTVGTTSETPLHDRLRDRHVDRRDASRPTHGSPSK